MAISGSVRRRVTSSETGGGVEEGAAQAPRDQLRLVRPSMRSHAMVFTLLIRLTHFKS